MFSIVFHIFAINKSIYKLAKNILIYYFICVAYILLWNCILLYVCGETLINYWIYNMIIIVDSGLIDLFSSNQQ
jgi:hypothetical protein